MREPAVKKSLDVDQAIRAACLSFPLRSHGKGEESRYTILSYVQTNRDLKDCFLHLRFEWNSEIEQDEALLVHIAEETRCRVIASQHPELVKQTSTKTYTYTGIEHDNIKLAFRLRDTK